MNQTDNFENNQLHVFQNNAPAKVGCLSHISHIELALSIISQTHSRKYRIHFFDQGL